MEALMFMLDVVVMTYLCWRIYRYDDGKGDQDALGYLAYDEGDPS